MTPGRCITDCHVHLWDVEGIAALAALCDRVGADRANIVSIIERDTVNMNPAAFAAKARFPERFYVFAGLDHTAYHSGGSVATPSLAEQVDRLVALGADGIKMLEAKPTSRKELDVAVDSPYFADFFARVEEVGLPLLWHVADPEEFWDPEKTPGWAKERGWGYDEGFIAKEHLYAEVENVLARYPRLKVVFAHFYFLSADLPRAAALFDRYEGVHFDLAPGIELLYSLSRDPDASRAFFERYSERILFGTDIISFQTPEEAVHRAGIIRRWLETDEEFRLPPGTDFLLGPPEDGIMRGLTLPPHVLDGIYGGNFERLAGDAPRRLDPALAAAECARIAAAIEALTGKPAAGTHAAAAATALRIHRAQTDTP